MAEQPEVKHDYTWHISYDDLQNIYKNLFLGIKKIPSMI